jgi:hypothetical protein
VERGAFWLLFVRARVGLNRPVSLTNLWIEIPLRIMTNDDQPLVIEHGSIKNLLAVTSDFTGHFSFPMSDKRRVPSITFLASAEERQIVFT